MWQFYMFLVTLSLGLISTIATLGWGRGYRESVDMGTTGLFIHTFFAAFGLWCAWALYAAHPGLLSGWFFGLMATSSTWFWLRVVTTKKTITTANIGYALWGFVYTVTQLILLLCYGNAYIW